MPYVIREGPPRKDDGSPSLQRDYIIGVPSPLLLAACR
jgi:hypothetical protein